MYPEDWEECALSIHIDAQCAKVYAFACAMLFCLLTSYLKLIVPLCAEMY